MDEIQTRVLAALSEAGKPLKAGDVATATGIDKDVVAKAIATLKKQGRVVSPKNCFYAPA